MQLLTACSRDVVELAFSPASDALVAACRLTYPLLWTLPARNPLTLPVPSPYVHCTALTFSADGNVVGWVSYNKRNEYDRTVGTSRVVELTPPNESVIAQVVCGPDRRLVARTARYGSGDRMCAFATDGRGGWNDLWGLAPDPALHGEPLAGSPRSDRFFTWEAPRAPRRGRLVARSALTGDEIAGTPIALDYVLGLAMHPEGDAAIVFKDASLYYWAAGERVEKIRTGVRKHYAALAYHPDGRHLLAGNNDATARLIDTHTWQVVRQYAWEIGKLTAVAVSPDGALAAVGSETGQVVVWDLDV